ncbi:MAG: leucyl/phenylalanyl-tRNA--protein transferase [Paracoccaceae bacterium]
MSTNITPEILLKAYAAGIFPMAESRDSTDLFWVDPPQRGVFPLDQFHISRSLRKTILSACFQARFDSDFEAVLDACADRQETWINAEIRALYLELHSLGYAHSQEIWQNDQLIGGVYGICIGQAFFGESMFSHRRDGSKIALTWLVDRLRQTGFQLFDTQFITPHLASLGAIEISRASYQDQLKSAIQTKANINSLSQPQKAQEVIQRNTQTS